MQNWNAPGYKPPLFLVPPAGGSGLGFRRLAHYLGEDQPIYTFQPVGVDGVTQPHTTTEEMAAHYIHEMRLLQPEGPYRIGGMCFGGHVAWEMAQQLKEQGALVGVILLLDPGPPANGPTWSYSPPPRKTPDYLWQRVSYHWMHGTLWEDMLKPRLRSLTSLYTSLYSKPHRDFVKLQNVQRHAQRNYHASPLSVRTLLLQSEAYSKQEFIERWETLPSGQFERFVVPESTHRGLLTENDKHTRKMAEFIQSYLDKLDIFSQEDNS